MQSVRRTTLVALCYMNIVIVDAQVVYSSINYNNDGNNDNFSVSDDGTHVSIYSGQPDVTDKHAMDCTAQVLMRGGGNDCRLGLTKMRVGWGARWRPTVHPLPRNILLRLSVLIS